MVALQKSSQEGIAREFPGLVGSDGNLLRGNVECGGLHHILGLCLQMLINASTTLCP